MSESFFSVWPTVVQTDHNVPLYQTLLFKVVIFIVLLTLCLFAISTTCTTSVQQALNSENTTPLDSIITSIKRTRLEKLFYSFISCIVRNQKPIVAAGIVLVIVTLVVIYSFCSFTQEEQIIEPKVEEQTAKDNTEPFNWTPIIVLSILYTLSIIVAFSFVIVNGYNPTKPNVSIFIFATLSLQFIIAGLLWALCAFMKGGLRRLFKSTLRRSDGRLLFIFIKLIIHSIVCVLVVCLAPLILFMLFLKETWILNKIKYVCVELWDDYLEDYEADCLV